MSNNNNNINGNKMYSSKDDIKDLLNKKAICDVNLKKELINEIFKDSFINIRDQCFSPSFNNNALNSARSNNEPQLNEFKCDDNIADIKQDLIYDSVLGFYYDPKTNNYYEINDLKR